MSQTRPIEFPADQAAELDAKAKAMGMTVPAYVRFMTSVKTNNLDKSFVDGVRYLMTHYPQTMKKLAQ